MSAGAYSFHEGDLIWTLGAFVAGLALAAFLRSLLRWYLMDVASADGRGGARFSGLKWQLGPVLPDEQGARERLLQKTEALCGVQRYQLEPPFLTCYRQGDGQDKHVDSKELPNEQWTQKDRAAFEANGGQRMVQCLCYLNDVDPQHGGATVFHHEAEILGF
ncbi:unnamed protein product [Effrenium voratum]|nr:unnamed protein product [Effrenium voratum]